ncbi:hypothetical protein [Bosea vaviloviae]|uniref:hypothetical protein n=1 Tax=Bosea vaviloviae TaxID=1526658 RepID=UPI000A5C98A1|nr:hypothetical protein [Bosea vaviloviae]
MTDHDNLDRARKERSPSFPFIPLKKALDRAQVMAGAHRRSPARASVVGETWGYSPSSSGLTQTIAALKAYGLLDDVSKGEDRRLQLSELAFRIMNDARPGAREAAIRDAALRPKLLGEYAQTWLPDRPSDAHCISELTLDRGFTTEAAKSFLRTFDDNASFAGLTNGDKESELLPALTADTPATQLRAKPLDEPDPPSKHAEREHRGLSMNVIGSPYRVTFTGSAIEISAIINSSGEADALVSAINALKILLPQKIETDE